MAERETERKREREGKRYRKRGTWMYKFSHLRMNVLNIKLVAVTIDTYII